MLPGGGPVIQEFATHLTRDVKRLVVDEDTGAQVFKYIRTGTNHFSLAFTYDCIAWSRETYHHGPLVVWIGDDYHDSILDARF